MSSRPSERLSRSASCGGQANGVAQGELEHGEADPDARGPGGHHAGQRNGIAVHALAREVVLGQPDAVEVHRLREARLGGHVVDGREVRLRRRRQAERQPAEPHPHS